ncbi:MAG: DUF805 domain-containing protein [Gammaproteobacteria bacterium]|nr:DUF805 domain-containing protein [Gammaproteobacteria bacterium]
MPNEKFSPPSRTFPESIQSCLQKYADFDGRASRSEYWWFFLFGWLCQVGGFFLGGTIGVTSGFFLSIFTVVALLLPTLAVGARRLHDINMSGWLQLSLIVYPLGLLSESRGMILLGLIIVIVFVVLFAADGKPEKNRYDEPSTRQ